MCLSEQQDGDGRESRETDRPSHSTNTSEVNAIRAALISHHFIIITIINIYLSRSTFSPSLPPSLFHSEGSHWWQSSCLSEASSVSLVVLLTFHLCSCLPRSRSLSSMFFIYLFFFIPLSFLVSLFLRHPLILLSFLLHHSSLLSQALVFPLLRSLATYFLF